MLKRILLSLALIAGPAAADGFNAGFFPGKGGGTAGSGVSVGDQAKLNSLAATLKIDPYPKTWNWQPLATSQAATADRIYLQQIFLCGQNVPCKVDTLAITVGTTVAGSMTAGLYGPVGTSGTCANAALVSSSAQTVQAGSVGTPQVFTFTTTPTLQPDNYCLALHASSTGAFYRHQDSKLITGAFQQQTQTYASGLPATLPGTLTNADSGQGNPVLQPHQTP